MRKAKRAFRALSTNRKGFIAILSSVALGQIFTFAASLLLSRTYSPTDFGIFTVVSACTMMLGGVAALRCELAVPLPEEERLAYSLVALGLAASGISAVLGTVVVAIAGSQIADAFGQPELAPWLWYIPPIASVLGAFLVLNQLAVRQQRYASVGRRNISQAVSTGASQVAMGLAGLRPGGLILGFGLGQALGALSLLRGSGLGAEVARAGRSLTSMATAMRRYRRFLLLLAPSGLINTAGLNLPVLMIAYSYGPQVAGWLGLTQRVLALPVTLIGTAMGQIYLAEASRAKREKLGGIDQLFAATTRRLAIASLALATPLIILGPWAFSIAFGSGWTESGLYAQALAIGLAIQLVATPISHTLAIFEHYFLQLAWDSGRLLLTVGAIFTCHLLEGSALQAIWALSVTLAISYGACWILSACAIRNHLRTQSIPPLPHRPSRQMP